MKRTVVKSFYKVFFFLVRYSGSGEPLVVV